MAYYTNNIYDKVDLLLERESWITRDSKVMDCVGKFDVTAFQLDGLRNRVRIKQLLWSDQNNFCVVTQLLFKTKNLSKTVKPMTQVSNLMFKASVHMDLVYLIKTKQWM